MKYRAAEITDLKALQELSLEAYGILRNELTPKNWQKMEAVLLSEDTFPAMLRNCYGFVCEENHRIIGMAFLVPGGNPTKIYSAETSYIRMVGVHPDAAGNGIAQMLTRKCMDKARILREKQISLHSAEIMYAARHIYEKLGFKKIRILDAHYGLKYWLYQYDIS